MATVNTDGSNGDIVRREHGYFGRGNKAAAGNGNARRMQEYRRMFLDAIHPETIPTLARRLQAEALQGDKDAMKLLFDYVMGKPSQAVELTGADGSPLGVNFAAVTTIVLDALSGPEHAEARVKIAGDLMRLGGDDAQ